MEEKQYKGRTINTMPVLLECRTEEDKRILGGDPPGGRLARFL